ncbi:calcium-binding protein [Roseomonas sp. CAU 1739]|uniref:calcium-binding protein n=1 Tax=Roseomonas sp. CAU 1739 TaxID=3140364 RepID=UPI00325A95DD
MSDVAAFASAAVPIGGFTLENAGAGTLASGIATLGQVFAQGELPTGAALTASIGGVLVSVQADVKSTWPDGSAKMVVLAVERPALVSGASVDVVLERAGASAGGAAALNIDTALQGQSFTVDLAINGAAAQHVDVLAALHDAIANGTASFWQAGPLATQARVEIAVPNSSMRMVFDVTAYEGGGFKVDAQFANDRAMEAVGGRVDYDVVAHLNGQEVLHDTLSQAQYQTVHETFASTATDGGQGLGDAAHGWLNIRQDIAELGRLGVVADYDLSVKIPATTLAAYQAAVSAAGWGDPLATNGITTDMPLAGGRPDLGITTQANSAWLISQDAWAAAYSLGQADAANAVPWHFWDEARGSVLSLDNYPLLWVDGRGGTGSPGDSTSWGLTQQVEGVDTTGWTTDRAHQPDLSFVPYVLTGDRWILDNVLAQAAWNVLDQWPYPRENGAGIVVDASNGQLRGSAWAMRQIENALWAAPDGSTEKAYFQELSDANWHWISSKIPEWTAQQGEAYGYIPLATENSHINPWQQDYFASTAISAASRGNQDALAYLNWAKNFLIGRFLEGPEGFNPRDGVAMQIQVSNPVTHEYYQTWKEIGDATVAAGWSHGDGWNGIVGEYGRIGLSTLAGIYYLTGDAQALSAYRLLEQLDYPRTADSDYGLEPQFAVRINDTSVPPLGNTSIVDPGYETIHGGAGADTLTAGAKPAMLIGSTGDDLYYVHAALDRVIELAGGGTDRIISSVSLTLMSEVENLTFVGTTALNATGNALDNTLVGNAGANVIAGGLGNDTIWGLAGADTLLGDGGADYLMGGEGADSMAGGAGDDIYLVDSAADVIFEAAGFGRDLVRSTVDYTLGLNVEDLLLLGPGTKGTGNSADNVITGNGSDNILSGLQGNDMLVGGAGADTLQGGDGADTLNGGTGADSMIGGAGDDVYYVDNAQDRVLEGPGGGIDHVISTISINLMAGVENLTLGGTLALNATGNALDNFMTGNAAGNSLNGGVGNDTLSGLGGDDTLIGGANADSLLGGIGNDTLYGGDGADTLNGGTGADSMIGGAGDDVYYVDNAQDRVLEGVGGGTDHVISTISINLMAWVENLTLGGVLALNANGNALDNSMTGNAAGNYLNGGLGNDTLSGLGGNDSLVGGGGQDLLIGGPGADTLTGGAGSDAFRFDVPNNGIDRITDFTHGVDHFEVSQAGFGNLLPAGALDPAMFSGNGVAVGTGPQFIYNATTGVLRWDADGTGSGAAATLAVLDGAPVLAAADFHVYSDTSVLVFS